MKPGAIAAAALPPPTVIEPDNVAATEPAPADATPVTARPLAGAPPGFWMQLGAFRERDGAFDFQRKVERELDWLAPRLAVFVDRELHRLQAGPYATRGEASSAAERLRTELQLVPLIVERR